MNTTLEQLLERYQGSENVQRLHEVLNIKESCSRVKIEGTVGSLDAFLLWSTYQLQPRPHIYIASEKERAAYLFNTLQEIGNKNRVAFLPDSFKRPQDFENLVRDQVLVRSDLVNRLVERKFPTVVITYPEALFEKVVSPLALDETRFEIGTGHKLDPDFIIEMLVEYGFDREDFVYEPGQFSIRGGIIDIFTYGNEYPYRVELFDDEVENIRTFDPTTQLSQQTMAKVSIVPNLNTRFEQKDKVSLFDILPKDTVVWMQEPEAFLDRLQNSFERAMEFADKVSELDTSDRAEIFRDRAFIRPTEVVSATTDFDLVFLNRPPETFTGDGFKLDAKLICNARAQPSFNRNFQLLIENLHENTADTVENFLFSENAKQIERFYSIFDDLDAQVTFHPIAKKISYGFIDRDVQVACYTDHEIFSRFNKYSLRKGFTKDQAINLKLLRELKPGDFVTHIDHGVGRFSGLEKIEINGHTQESVRLIYKNNDILYVSINSLHKLSKYLGKEGVAPGLSKLGSDAWANLKRRTKKKVKDMAGELIKLYAKRRASKGHAFPEDGYLQNELEASFIYEDTPDQLSTTVQVKEDMMKPYPMDRLICGDVGFGKTEIAIRAAFKAVADGTQVAVLVPTTILALQHAQTFRERLSEFGVKVDYVNRFRSTAEKKQIFADLKEGKIEIVIGTHALLNKDVGFKDLGLLIVDEEQKFGVGAKEKLRKFKVNVDTLTLTATPIPRTLQFSLMSARDLSVIRTPPPNRQPVHTEIRIFNEEVIRESIYYEINRGGQVFFVHNRVNSLPDMTALVRRLCPDVAIESAHGQMDSKKLEKTLVDFIDHKFDVLLCTNIIETGLDIANANTILINNAHQFGLSDLHQLRGRVGRSNKKAFCYLFSPPLSVLTTEARKRLRTLEEFSDLGSGFDIAMRDLDIRGAGNLLGGEQSGFISEIGYDAYQKILEEAIQELKEQDFKEVFAEELAERKEYVREVNIDTDVEMLIPTEYVESTTERLRLYQKLDELKDEAAIERFEEMLRDRFGRVPKQVYELFAGLRLRWICRRLGFERVVLKNGKLRCFFVENPQSPFFDSPAFQEIFNYIATDGTKMGLSLKKTNRHLIMIRDGVRTLGGTLKLLSKLEERAYPE